MTRKQQRLSFVFAAAAMGLVAAVLAVMALGRNVTLFYSPAELAALATPPDRAIRVGGLVEDGSVVRADDGAFRFALTDLDGRVEVVYHGVPPDLFREGQGVVVLGQVGAGGIFEAKQLLAKHDENYMPAEVAEALKASGRWKDGEPIPNPGQAAREASAS